MAWEAVPPSTTAYGPGSLSLSLRSRPHGSSGHRCAISATLRQRCASALRSSNFYTCLEPAPQPSTRSQVLLDTEGIDAYNQVVAGVRVRVGLRSLGPVHRTDQPRRILHTLSGSLPVRSLTLMQTTQDGVSLFSLAVLLSSLFVFNQVRACACGLVHVRLRVRGYECDITRRDSPTKQGCPAPRGYAANPVLQHPSPLPTGSGAKRGRNWLTKPELQVVREPAGVLAGYCRGLLFSKLTRWCKFCILLHMYLVLQSAALIGRCSRGKGFGGAGAGSGAYYIPATVTANMRALPDTPYLPACCMGVLLMCYTASTHSTHTDEPRWVESTRPRWTGWRW